MWRKYFAIKRYREVGDVEPVPSEANNRIYDLCHRIFTDRFVAEDQEILKMYFTSRWGDDLYAVEDYSLKHGMTTRAIWMVIRRGNRLIWEELGLLDRKEG